MSAPILLLLAAAAANGLLAGASLDQSIKQLPARKTIGVAAFSRYSQAADLANGVAWYAILGIGTALLTTVAAIVGLADHPPAVGIAALAAMLVTTIGHMVATSRAAPINFSQRKAGDDEAALTAVFDRFTRWQTARAVLNVLALLSTLWAIVALA
jgi:hypothetical protein